MISCFSWSFIPFLHLYLNGLFRVGIKVSIFSPFWKPHLFWTWFFRCNLVDLLFLSWFDASCSILLTWNDGTWASTEKNPKWHWGVTARGWRKLAPTGRPQRAESERERERAGEGIFRWKAGSACQAARARGREAWLGRLGSAGLLYTFLFL
jgi:hypothetical protein